MFDLLGANYSDSVTTQPSRQLGPRESGRPVSSASAVFSNGGVNDQGSDGKDIW
jgi:hypothetical protein